MKNTVSPNNHNRVSHLRVPEPGTVICRIPGSGKKWGVFSSPTDTVTANSYDAIIPAIVKIQQATKAGKYAAGFISYEASVLFDKAHKTVEDFSGFPFVHFYIYDIHPTDFHKQTDNFKPSNLHLIPEIDEMSYRRKIEKIKNYISNGDIYQANFTFRSITKNISNPYKLFYSLFNSHPVPYAAYIHTGNYQIVSSSPELFLRRDGDKISSSPMKGTASRAPGSAEDINVSNKLKKDAKNCAENVMIVDMVRNDFGKICSPGTIYVSPLFHVETYPTVHQMISTVHGTLQPDTDLLEVLKATFPPASITGAPKIRAMEIIAEQEQTPRKVYTGTIGCMFPGQNWYFNVAIRTLICSESKTELGIGSGIVADSTPRAEWQESLLKSDFVSYKLPEFDILETLLWTHENGFEYLTEHLNRAKNSQHYFSRTWHQKRIENCLANIENELRDKNIKFARVRLLISENGLALAEYSQLKRLGWKQKKLKILISNDETAPDNVFLFHKTTHRKFYDIRFSSALKEGYDEVIFRNRRQEITEGAISNIFIKKRHQWFTPPLSSGLLPGIWREKKIKELNAVEAKIYLENLEHADSIIIGNSVRNTGKVTTFSL